MGGRAWMEDPRMPERSRGEHSEEGSGAPPASGRRGKRVLAGVTVSFFLLGSLGLAISEAGERAVMLGGPSGGIFGIFATGVSTHLSRAVPGLDVSVAATAGSVENVRRVNAGEAEMGIAFTSDLHEAFLGLGAFRGTPQTKVRAVGLLLIGTVHVVTFRDSGIRTVEDLVGKRVAVGSPGTGTFGTAERLFRALGIWDRITRVPLLGALAGAALSEGKADAFLWPGPEPDRVVLEAAVARPVHLIDVYTPASRTDFFKTHPYFTRHVIPAGIYRGVTDDVATLGVSILWIARSDLAPGLVQTMARTVYSPEGYEHMVRVHTGAKSMTPEKALTGVTIPLHPGAEAHWRAVGLQIPESIHAR